MSELCCICKKNISYIHIDGDGDYWYKNFCTLDLAQC